MPSPKISAEYKFAGASLVGFRVKFLSPRFGAVLEHLDSARIVFAAILPASLIPVLAEPRLIIRALENLRAMKTFMSADAVNTTTGPQLPKYISHAFGSLDQPWKPGYLRSAYGAICCHRFKPQNQTDDIFLAQILGHKLLGPSASLSVGQSYKDFYIKTEPLGCLERCRWSYMLGPQKRQNGLRIWV